MAGGLHGDTMVMRGRRQTLAGADIFDEYRWHVLPTGQVVQAWKLDVPVGAAAVLRRAHLHARAHRHARPRRRHTTACQPGGGGLGAPTRQPDFLLGTWTVAAEQGPALGTAAITGDLSGCLAEESYATDKGYAATSWFYFDPRFNEFFRTYIDSEGERVELRGTLHGRAAGAHGDRTGARRAFRSGADDAGASLGRRGAAGVGGLGGR